MAQAAKHQGTGGRSLKAVSTSALVAGIVLAFGIGLLIFVTSSLHRGAMENVVRDVHTLDIVERLEGNLLYYAQVSNVDFAQRTERTRSMRDTVRTRIGRLERSLAALARSDAERAVLRDTHEAIDAYFRRRAEAEVGREMLRPVVIESAPTLDRALGDIARLRSINRAQVDESNERDARLRRVNAVAGAGASVIVIAGVLGLVAFLRRQIVRPLLHLTRAVESFRAGNLRVRTPEAGPRELRAVARALSDAGEALADQRRARSTFVASVAHDLRTPLQAVRTSVEILREDPEIVSRPDLASIVERIDRQSNRLLFMANDLGDASQVEAGKLSIAKHPVDLRDPVRAMVELYRPTSATHTLDLDVPAEPVVVAGDPVRIEQVAGNLISNAIKYSPEGGRVHVALDTTDGHAVLTVSDEGIGIEREEIPKLFSPFHRGDRSYAVTSGSGLGLWVSERIVTAHGGNIDVRSEPGAGTSFRVEFPLAKRATGSAGSAHAPRPP